MRFRPERRRYSKRIRVGEERAKKDPSTAAFSSIALENVGATGYRRSWDRQISSGTTPPILSGSRPLDICGGAMKDADACVRTRRPLRHARSRICAPASRWNRPGHRRNPDDQIIVATGFYLRPGTHLRHLGGQRPRFLPAGRKLRPAHYRQRYRGRGERAGKRSGSAPAISSPPWRRAANRWYQAGRSCPPCASRTAPRSSGTPSTAGKSPPGRLVMEVTMRTNRLREIWPLAARGGQRQWLAIASAFRPKPWHQGWDSLTSICSTA